MKFIGIIPARFDSSRFPGKPMQMICGKTMIQRVYEQCKKAKVFSDLVVATDDARIADHVSGFGGKAIMTSDKHKCGTERCNEAIKQLNISGIYNDGDVVVNIQGDEPLIKPLQLELITTCFKSPDVSIATLVKKITAAEDIFNQNCIKVVCNKFSEALYFSRSPIPLLRGIEKEAWISKGIFFKHIGIYAYKIGMLNKITKLEPSILELSESLEQLRWLENGINIKVAVTDYDSHSVDVPDDVLVIERMIKKNSN